MQIWNYNPITGELIGPGVADPSPVEKGAWIVPAHAMLIAPPADQTGFARIFSSTGWSSVADHRGETWWPTTQQYNQPAGVVVDFLGDPTARGLTKTEPPAPPVVIPPLIVTPRQIRLALTRLGLRAAIETYVSTADQDTKDSWQFSTEFDRGHSMVTTAAAALGKAAADVDALFELAKTL